MLNQPVRVSPEGIEAAYEASGNTLGWRLLCSPSRVLGGARIAFIGLNPAGRIEPHDHPSFAPATGSAYVDECWDGRPPGQSKLQIQVKTLMARLNAQPQDVLAGNLVPFRSPSWKELENRMEALSFGEKLWKAIFRDAGPELVVGMGREVEKSLLRILDGKIEDRIGLGWGRGRKEITGTLATFDGGRLVGLPHLSRFGVVTRSSSQKGLSELFGKWWHA